MRPTIFALVATVLTAMPVAAQPVMIDTRTAEVGHDEQTGQPALTISLSPEGQRAFSAFTMEHVGKTIDVLVDGEIVTSPTIHTPIQSDWILVTGPFTLDELETMAETIKNNGDAVSMRPAKIKSGP